MMGVYGFAGAVATVILLAAYFLWVFLPDELLAGYAGPSFRLPDRFWAAVPPATLLVVIYLYTAVYAGAALVLNPDPSAWTTVADGHIRTLRVSDLGSHGTGAGAGAGGSTPEFFGDVPAVLVNRLQARAVRAAEAGAAGGKRRAD